MSDYVAPMKDMQFVLDELAGLADRVGGAVRRGGIGQRSAGGQQGGAGDGV